VKLSFPIPGYRFYASKTCAIDFSHKSLDEWFPDKKCEKTKITIFASKPFFPESGPGKVFTFRECAQSIHRIKLPLEGSFVENKFSGPKKFLKSHSFEKKETFAET
jgi:hypothetical protein